MQCDASCNLPALNIDKGHYEAINQVNRKIQELIDHSLIGRFDCGGTSFTASRNCQIISNRS